MFTDWGGRKFEFGGVIYYQDRYVTQHFERDQLSQKIKLTFCYFLTNCSFKLNSGAKIFILNWTLRY